MSRFMRWALAIMVPFIVVIKARLLYWIAAVEWNEEAGRTVILCASVSAVLAILIAGIIEGDRE